MGRCGVLLWIAYNKIKSSMADDALVLATAHKVLPFKSAVNRLGGDLVKPHFYLDTLLLMGNLASQWQQDKWWFVAEPLALLLFGSSVSVP